MDDVKKFYLSFLLVLFTVLSFANDSLAINTKQVPEVKKKMVHETVKKTTSIDGRYIDNGDGTVRDSKTGLLWAQKDSYADLNSCLNWKEAKKYVRNLRTGGYSDWRAPTVKELKSLLELSKSNNMAFDHDPEYPLHLDSIFANGASDWHWTSELVGSDCAYFVSFIVGYARRYCGELCYGHGVRAVRSEN